MIPNAQRRESEIQAAILKALPALGVVAFPYKPGGFRATYTTKAGEHRTRFIRTGKRGVADIVGYKTVRVRTHLCRNTACHDARANFSLGHDIERNIFAGADAIGWHYHTTMRAVWVSIEVKSARGRLTPEQEAFSERVRRDGGIHIIARSVDDVIKGLAT